MLRSLLCRPLWCIALLVACAGNRDTSLSSGSSMARCGCPIDWQIDNLAVCVSAHTAFTETLLYSSSLDAGKLHCDPARAFPQPLPDQPWSAQRVSSPCTGAATLTLRVRQGSAAHASEQDCIIAEQSFDLDYSTAGRALELPPTAAFSAQDKSCARAYEDSGGYLEFRVKSADFGCAESDEVVKYVDQCPVGCDEHPAEPQCKVCGQPTLTNSF